MTITAVEQEITTIGTEIQIRGSTKETETITTIGTKIRQQ